MAAEPAAIDSASGTRLAPFEVLAAGSLALLVILGSVAAYTQDWVPASDAALIALRVEDVPGHLPLTGAWSRLGWSHPGPLHFYLLAVPYRLAMSDPAGLMVATLLLASGGTAVAWGAARTRDRLAGALVLAALVAVMAGREPVDLRDPWNPYVGIVLAGTLVVLAWAASEQRPVGALSLLAVGSLLVQAHVGYLPLVAAVLLGTLAAALLPGSRAAPLRAWALGAAAAALVWLPPLYQQLTGEEGNLAAIVRDLLDGGDPVGLGTALRTVSAAFAVPPTWLGRTVPLGTDGLEPAWTVPVLAVVPIAALVVAIRRRDTSGTRALVVCIAALCGTTAGIARITGAFHEYLFSGLGAVAAVSVGLGAWVLVDNLAGSTRVLFRTTASVLVACALVTTAAAVRQFGVEGPYESTAAGVGELAPALLEDVGDADAFIESVGEFTAYAALPGFVLALEDAGVDVAVPEDSEREFGEHRVDDAEGRVHYLVALPGMVPRLTEQGWTVVGSHDPLPAAASMSAAALDAAFGELREQLEATIEAGGDPRELNRLIDENREEAYEVRSERFPLAVLRAP